MSVLIRDMEMPKSCIACPFEHNGDCYGGKPKRIMDIEDFKDSRHLDCPLMEAEPTKHYNTESYKMTVTDFPPVEYAPIKHGRWIRKDSKRYYWFECSECGYPPPLDKFKREWFSGYCPNCGAKMDESEAEE